MRQPFWSLSTSVHTADIGDAMSYVKRGHAVTNLFLNLVPKTETNVLRFSLGPEIGFPSFRPESASMAINDLHSGS